MHWIVLSNFAGARSYGRGTAQRDLARSSLTHPNFNGSTFGGMHVWKGALFMFSLNTSRVDSIAFSLGSRHGPFHPVFGNPYFVAYICQGFTSFTFLTIAYCNECSWLQRTSSKLAKGFPRWFILFPASRTFTTLVLPIPKKMQQCHTQTMHELKAAVGQYFCVWQQ